MLKATISQSYKIYKILNLRCWLNFICIIVIERIWQVMYTLDAKNAKSEGSIILKIKSIYIVSCEVQSKCRYKVETDGTR